MLKKALLSIIASLFLLLPVSVFAASTIWQIATSTSSTTYPILSNGVYASVQANYFTGTSTATSTFAGGIISPCFATSTGSNCITGQGGSGTNYFTNVGATTSLTTGSILSAGSSTVGSFTASSTTGKNFIAGFLGVGSANPPSAYSINTANIGNTAGPLLLFGNGNASLPIGAENVSSSQDCFEISGQCVFDFFSDGSFNAFSSDGGFIQAGGDGCGALGADAGGNRITVCPGGTLAVNTVQISNNAGDLGDGINTFIPPNGGGSTYIDQDISGVVIGDNGSGIGAPGTGELDVFGDITDENIKSQACIGTNSAGTIINGTCSGSNYFTNSGASTTLSTGSNLLAGIGTFGSLIATTTTRLIGQLTFSTASGTAMTATATSTFTGLKLTNLSNTVLAVDPSGNVIATTTGSGAVSSVSNSDGTLTVSPTTGSVVASIALTHANTWTGGQTFTNASSTNLSATDATTTNFLTATLKATGQTTLATASSTGLTVTSTSTLTGVRLTNLSNAYLAVDANGNIIATTTPTGSASSSQLLAETPSGTVNGVNTSFTVQNSPVQFFLNGLLQATSTDYTSSGSGPYTISMVSAPATSSILKSYYGSVAGGGGGGATPGGASSTVQFNCNGALCGDTNFVWNGSKVGVGSSTPTANLTVAGTAGQTNNLFSVSSSSNATSTSYFIDNQGFIGGGNAHYFMSITFNSSQSIPGTTFTRLTFPSGTLYDPSGSWDNSNHWYTVPVSGIYQVVSQIRYIDGTTGSVSYENTPDVNADDDEASGLWQNTVTGSATLRNGSFVQRLSHFNKGDTVRDVTYYDGGGATLSSAAFSVNLLSADN